MKVKSLSEREKYILALVDMDLDKLKGLGDENYEWISKKSRNNCIKGRVKNSSFSFLLISIYNFYYLDIEYNDRLW